MVEYGLPRRDYSASSVLWKIPGAFPRDDFLNPPCYTADNDDLKADVDQPVKSYSIPILSSPSQSQLGIVAAQLEPFPPTCLDKQNEATLGIPETNLLEQTCSIENHEPSCLPENSPEASQQCVPELPSLNNHGEVQDQGVEISTAEPGHDFPVPNTDSTKDSTEYSSNPQRTMPATAESISRWAEFAKKRSMTLSMHHKEQLQQTSVCTKNTSSSRKASPSSLSSSNCEPKQNTASKSQNRNEASRPLIEGIASTAISPEPSSLKIPAKTVELEHLRRASTRAESKHNLAGTSAQAPVQSSQTQIEGKPRVEARWVDNEDFTSWTHRHPSSSEPAKDIELANPPRSTQKEEAQHQSPRLPSQAMSKDGSNFATSKDEHESNEKPRDTHKLNEDAAAINLLDKLNAGSKVRSDPIDRIPNETIIKKMIENTKSLQASKWAPVQQKPPVAKPLPTPKFTYEPSNPTINDFRTVGISGLPSTVTLSDITSILGGRCTLSINIMRGLPTQKGKVTMAIVVFQEGQAAVAFMNHAKWHGVYMPGMDPKNPKNRLSVWISGLPTHPTPKVVNFDICYNGCTRFLSIQRIPGPVERSAMLHMLRVAHPIPFASDGLGSGMAEVRIPENEEKPKELEEGEIRETGYSCEIHFHSIEAAMSVVRTLAKLPGLKVTFLPDPCSKSIQKLARVPEMSEQRELMPLASTSMPMAHGRLGENNYNYDLLGR
ncbi:hypothetical protein AAP_01767 [Ascosphaera apis ARSEF 7405]|uniref:Uncharacterized protein n=1 Tax=Ascosphaera apis ARSEF 7405 TaxID=392613 RepID=A0A168AX45_9EURO|nr:hypothetical protein AAP_01767 [Ascosphaera apis ARSEF 7405]